MEGIETYVEIAPFRGKIYSTINISHLRWFVVGMKAINDAIKKYCRIDEYLPFRY